MSSVADGIIRLLQVLGFKTPDGSKIQSANIITYQNTYSLGELDENDLIPKRLAIGALSINVIPVPFEAVTGLVIDWQSDVPPDQTESYVSLLGNNIPKPVIVAATENENEFIQIAYEVRYIIVDGEIQTATFDWAINQTGTITF